MGLEMECAVTTEACGFPIAAEHSGIQTVENIESGAIVDMLISDVYRGAPRWKPFIRYCDECRKTTMRQLDAADFENAVRLRGVGRASADNLRQIWDDYLRFPPLPKPELSDSGPNARPEYVFGGLPHGEALIRFCRSMGWSALSDMRGFSFDAAEISGISPAAMKMFRKIVFERLNKSKEDENALVYPDIAEQNLPLPLSVLKLTGVAEAHIDKCTKSGLKTLGDLKANGIRHGEHRQLKAGLQPFAKPVTEIFCDTLDRLKGNACQCLLRRAQGDTLQSIADDFGITREWVRQINEKSCRRLSAAADMTAMLFTLNGRVCFSGEDICSMFAAPEAALCCKYVLSCGSEYVYIKPMDKLVITSACDGDIDDVLERYTAEVVGGGLNFFENLENIEEQLQAYGLGFFDFEDVMKYLASRGYHFYGDYVTKGKGSYARVCYDAVLKFFEFDIKLDNDENNADMRKLREIIDRRYGGAELPDNNRALCARLAVHMVLSDRGRYCPAEKISYSAKLMEDIFRYINESAQTTFYYTELFAAYRERLLAESNITNPNFLHGVLKYLYPEDFAFERDLLVKTGAERKDVNQRICELLTSCGRPVTKAEILHSIPGLNEFVLGFAVARLPGLIQWEYGSYNHAENLRLTDADRRILRALIDDEQESLGGYASEMLLYRRVKKDYPEFIERNGIKSSHNLYYTCAYMLEDSYRFRRPHILSRDFPVEDLTVANIMKAFLGDRQVWNYGRFIESARRLGWANGTLYSVFSSLEKDYVRISEDEYIASDCFAPSAELLDGVAAQIGGYVKAKGYFAIDGIRDYSLFPDCDMPWNGFLLQLFIEKYDLGYRLLEPQVKSRRYQRGVIVPASCTARTFESLVLLLLRQDGMSSFSEREFEKYLRDRGLILKVIPLELYDCPVLQFKDGVFTVRE